MMKSNMSMTLPRWFGRKTQKKIERKNEDQEDETKNDKSNRIAHKSVGSPMSYLPAKNSQNIDGNGRLDVTTVLQQRDKSQYVQEQPISNQVTEHMLGGQTLVQRKVGSVTINYENIENIPSTYPNVEHNLEKKTSVIMSPTIYGGR